MYRTQERSSSSNHIEASESDYSSGNGGSKPFYEVETREVGIGELLAELRALQKEMREWAEWSSRPTRSGGIPIIGPIRYPLVSKAKGKGSKNTCSLKAENMGGAVREGFPPGLFRPSAPCPAKPSNRQQPIQGDPVSRLAAEEYRRVGKGMDLWSFLGNTRGIPS